MIFCTSGFWILVILFLIYGLVSAVFYDVVHHKDHTKHNDRNIVDIFERNKSDINLLDDDNN